MWFAFFALLEGIGWGVMPLAAAVNGRFEIEMLIVAVTLGVAAGSIPAYSPYLPAFAAFFFPATIPYAAWSIIFPTPLHQATTLLMLLFIGAMVFVLSLFAPSPMIFHPLEAAEAAKSSSWQPVQESYRKAFEERRQAAYRLAHAVGDPDARPAALSGFREAQSAPASTFGPRPDSTFPIL